MEFTPHDILDIASQDYILRNTDLNEQVDFIKDQIADPLDSGTANHFKRLRKLAQGEELDSICTGLLTSIEDRYPLLDFDLSGYDKPVADVFGPVYKFFVKNIAALMHRFLREYIYTSKNRKMLVSEYLGIRLPSYPKEQYGKKEYYILLNKLPSIIGDIAQDDTLSLEEFISYLERGGELPVYIAELQQLIDNGVVCEHGVVMNMFELFRSSNKHDSVVCKLQVDITQNIIIPYLEDNGLMALRLPPVQPIEPEGDDEEEDEEYDD